MALYFVQDSDRPMHVMAPSFGDALESWRDFIRLENVDDPVKEPFNPDGIMLVADDDSILNWNWKLPQVMTPQELVNEARRRAREIVPDHQMPHAVACLAFELLKKERESF